MIMYLSTSHATSFNPLSLGLVMRNNLALQEKFKMAFALLLVDFTLVISVLSLLSSNHKGEYPNITPQLRNY
jgi:hypothetical protein